MKSDTSPADTSSSFRADLHTHTTCSDGTLTPCELVALAVQTGLKGLSITDHDTIEAYETALPEAERLGLELLPGVEFSAKDVRESVHILGYGFALDDEYLLRFCEERLASRRERNEEILRRLSGRGMPVSQEEVEQLTGIAGKNVFGRPHIAHAMVAKGYVTSPKAAFDKWLGDGRPCYASPLELSVGETIEKIHRAGGRAVLAHPHLLRMKSTVNNVLQLKFDGIEGYYSMAAPSVERPWIELGRSRGWLVTGGSDFHGGNRPNTPLGCSWVDETTFRALKGSIS